jgi:hypothetical protein
LLGGEPLTPRRRWGRFSEQPSTAGSGVTRSVHGQTSVRASGMTMYGLYIRDLASAWPRSRSPSALALGHWPSAPRHTTEPFLAIPLQPRLIGRRGLSPNACISLANRPTLSASRGACDRVGRRREARNREVRSEGGKAGPRAEPDRLAGPPRRGLTRCGLDNRCAPTVSVPHCHVRYPR